MYVCNCISKYLYSIFTGKNNNISRPQEEMLLMKKAN